ncbi:MAG: PH domain-containing protein, partial [Blastocatellia bacterium]
VYTVAATYIEEEYGIIYKRLRRIPLSYVRDVTQTQNFLQAMFRTSSITISPTNGDTIILSNIKNGQQARDAIWQGVLSESCQRRS